MFNFVISIFSTSPTPYIKQYSDEDVDAAIGMCLVGERKVKQTSYPIQQPTPKKPAKKKEEPLPNNIKQLILPDGSVVLINTDETEMTEESVVDSIIGNK